MQIEYFSNARVDNTELEKEILEIAPTHVVSFKGEPRNVENTITLLLIISEQDGKIVKNVRDNLFSPVSLALLCRKYNAHYTYLGTGCIFSENTNVMDAEKYGFDEHALPNFFGSAYSTVKGFTDRLMHFSRKY